MEPESLDRQIDDGQCVRVCESVCLYSENDRERYCGWLAMQPDVKLSEFSTHTHTHTHTLQYCVRNWSADCQDVSLRDG